MTEETQTGELNKNTVAYVRTQAETLKQEVDELNVKVTELCAKIDMLHTVLREHIEIFNKHVVDLHINR